MDINSLLDKCREVCGARTDIELAAKLRVSKQAVSGWRNGHRLPDTVTCATIAGLTGEPLARVIGIVEEARAVSREEKAVWRKLAATAALMILCVLPVAGTHAATTGYALPFQSVHIMSKRLAMFMAGLERWLWRMVEGSPPRTGIHA